MLPLCFMLRLVFPLLDLVDVCYPLVFYSVQSKCWDHYHALCLVMDLWLVPDEHFITKVRDGGLGLFIQSWPEQYFVLINIHKHDYSWSNAHFCRPKTFAWHASTEITLSECICFDCLHWLSQVLYLLRTMYFAYERDFVVSGIVVQKAITGLVPNMMFYFTFLLNLVVSRWTKRSSCGEGFCRSVNLIFVTAQRQRIHRKSSAHQNPKRTRWIRSKPRLVCI